jgi:ABC-type Mn2+/Zn2+ transport system ATPase subunit
MNYLEMEAIRVLKDVRVSGIFETFFFLHSGNFVKMIKGEGNEFFEHREYHIGDEIKNINWKIFARTGRLFTKVFSSEVSKDVVVLLDNSKSMSGGKEKTKLEYSKYLVSVVMYKLISEGYNVLFSLFSDELDRIYRVSNKNFLKFQDFLSTTKCSGITNFKNVWMELATNVRKRVNILVVSDLLFLARKDIVNLRYLFPSSSVVFFQVLSEEEIKFFDENLLELFEPGEAQRGEIIGIIGPNSIGKTTFIKLLAGLEKPDEGEAITWQGLTISYKPQYISINYDGVVFELLKSIAKEKINEDAIQNGLIKPLGLMKLLDREIKSLSGGELQRVAIATCLIKDAQIYLLDEPSAYLDVEERLAVAKLIKRIIEEKEGFAFIVEHDIVSQDALADKLMVFTGEPEKFGVACTPVSLRNGMNTFLSSVKVTFRRDPETGRPRANKFDSKMDRWQKDKGEYYYI